MRTRAAAVFLCCFLVGLTASPAWAQYKPKHISDPATGETYHVEVGGYLWNPTPDIAITSESLGIIGSRIDFVQDLGIEKTKFKQIKVVLRPAVKHKFRFEYTPIKYDAVGSINRQITFNGQKFPISFPVATALSWKAYRFAYEYDFVHRDRGFFGLVLEAKYTEVRAALTNILVAEFVQARAPIPSIGAIARVYVAPNISITGELSGLRTGNLFGEDYRAHYADIDIYGTVNFSNNFGVQTGYRSFNVFYHVKEDEGELKLKGPYLGGVVRF